MNLMMTDTDSFLYHIKNQDTYKIMKKNKEKFDLGNYPKHHILYDTTNNKVVNKFEDEKGGLEITTAFCLTSKLYSLICEQITACKNTCKGAKQIIMMLKLIEIYVVKEV